MSDFTRSTFTQKSQPTSASSRQGFHERINNLLRGGKNSANHKLSANFKKEKPESRKSELATFVRFCSQQENGLCLAETDSETLERIQNELELEIRNARLVLDSVRAQNKICDTKISEMKSNYRRFLNQKLILNAEQKITARNNHSEDLIRVLSVPCRRAVERMTNKSYLICGTERDRKRVCGHYNLETTIETGHNLLVQVRRFHAVSKAKNAFLLSQNEHLRNAMGSRES